MKNFEKSIQNQKKCRANTIVIGGINVDFVFTGYKKLLKAGELAESTGLKILPGGKSRNIAQMMANFKESGQVSMIGRTSKDKFGLWKVPVEAIEKSGVNIDFIQYSKSEEDLPGIAAIPIFENGENQIFLSNGVNTHFSKEDIRKAESLFQEVGENNGILVLALEMPIETAKEAFILAKKYGVKIALDTGGINRDQIKEYIDLFSIGIDFLKPNVHETEILTNVIVHDLYSAKQAAKEFQKIAGVSTVLITTGAGGAYLVHNKEVTHIPIPQVKIDSSAMDSTGCGDQTMAVLCHFISEGVSVKKSCELAVLAGTLQFYREGVIPLGKKDLLTFYTK